MVVKVPERRNEDLDAGSRDEDRGKMLRVELAVVKYQVEVRYRNQGWLPGWRLGH